MSELDLPLLGRRRLLAVALGGAAAALGARTARAQFVPLPGAPTPGVQQASIAPPAPSPDVSMRVSPTARGKSLMVVNKLGLTVGFYDAVTGERQASFSLPSRPHELLVSRDVRTAWVSIYGDGIYGQNPHPGTQIAVIDLVRKAPVGFLSTGDIFAPHGLAQAPDGTVWASCDIGGAVVGFDARSGERIAVIETGTKGGHWIANSADGPLAYLSNRSGPGIHVVDLLARKHVGVIDTPHAVTGLDVTPDGTRLFAADDQEPALLTIDTGQGRVVSSTPLKGLPRETAKGGDRERRVRVAPTGQFVFVADYPSAGFVRLDVRDPRQQRLILVEHGPMGMAFSPDGATAWVCNHDAGTLTIVDTASMSALVDFKVGEGPETAALLV